MRLATCSNIKRVKIWWQAIRFHFTFPSFVSTMVATNYAIVTTNSWEKTSFFMILATLILHHIGLNLIDDYYDYKHGTDLAAVNNKNFYSGGSGMLTNGKIRPNTMLVAAICCYLSTVAIGLYLVYLHGYWVLWFGVFGVLSSFYYTAPPLKLAYRGFGEILIWLNFGPVLVLGSYFIHTTLHYPIPIGAALLSIVCGTLMFCLIIANELPDYRADFHAGKRNLVVCFGKQFGLIVLCLGISSITIICSLAIMTHIWPKYTAITLLALPLAYFGVKKLSQTIHYESTTGNEFIVGFCNCFGILLIVSFNWQLINNNQIIPAIIMFVVTGVFYLPIIFGRNRST